MKSKQTNNISESQVEDAIVANLYYLKRLLNSTNDLRLIARQLRLKSGEQRIDLLIADGKDLCLIELKVTKYINDFLFQTINYKEELLLLQNEGKIINGKIKSFLLVTHATDKHKEFCGKNEVKLIIYEPIDVLIDYYNNLSLVAPFLKIKPNDYGVYNLGLMNRTLIQLNKGKTKQDDIANTINLSKGSIHNHLKVSKEFGLVRERNKNYFLTDLGDKYINNLKLDVLIDKLSTNQIEILKQFIAKNPFYSSVVFGIYSIVESAFLLSRNSYPIQLSDLSVMFRTVSGKVDEWIAEKSLSTVTYTFLNFAVDLELLGKIGKQIVITPSGFKFILMLQLHKSIEMVESLTIKK